MWIHVPSTSSASVRASEDWTSDCEVSSLLERCAWWNGKSASPRSLRRAWQTAPSIRALSGLTLRPSTLNRGVAEWISSLAPRPASPGQPPANNEELMTNATCGPQSHGSQKASGIQLSLWKTSPVERCSPTTTTPSGPSFSAWATALRKDSLLRQKQALRIRGNDSSSWPTATRLWGTPTQDSATMRQNKYAQGGTPLAMQAGGTHWPTPAARDHKQFDGAKKKKPSRPRELYLSIRQGQATTPDGHACSHKCLRLNPLFVSYLMGLPPQWPDDSAPLATQSFRQWEALLGSYLVARKEGMLD
jgi:hypothetical protein